MHLIVKFKPGSHPYIVHILDADLVFQIVIFTNDLLKYKNLSRLAK